MAFQLESHPTWTKKCACGNDVSRWPGEMYPDCGNCGADYNASGQRLREGWDRNMSNYDDEVGDMEGYEAQYAAADEAAELYN